MARRDLFRTDGLGKVCRLSRRSILCQDSAENLNGIGAVDVRREVRRDVTRCWPRDHCLMFPLVDTSVWLSTLFVVRPTFIRKEVLEEMHDLSTL